MLSDYVDKAATRGVALEATALRTESTAMRAILAHAASDGRLECDELVKNVLAGSTQGLDPEWTAKLARVCALQQSHDTDLEFALRAFKVMNAALPKTVDYRRFHKLHVELLTQESQYEDAERLIEQNPDLQALYYGYLKTDLKNPFLRQDPSLHTAWLEAFNAPLRNKCLAEIRLNDDIDQKPFDRLETATELSAIEDGPLVTVIMTTYHPDPNGVLVSARSIIEQSWRNIELLVVDDGSPSEYNDTLDALASLDPRVRVIRLLNNGGTYRARNVGISEAQGKYITGQDADDWSHPHRIERQVRTLEADPALPAVQAFAITMNEDLVRMRPGYNPFIQSAPTLMVKQEIAEKLGGYLDARKAADNEFRHRISRFTGKEVKLLKEPLIFMRILASSLSRGDFRAGWQHPARRAFWSSYVEWHESAVEEELAIRPGEDPPVFIPERFKVERTRTDNRHPEYDVVFVGDWRQLGGPQISMLNEIEALRQQDLQIAVMHLEATRFMASSAKKLCAPVQKLINEGAVTQLLPDEKANLKLLVLRYPPILQFPPDTPISASVERLIILANQAPSERDGSDIRYIPVECADNAERLFGTRGTWAPQGPTVRSALDGLLDPDEIAEYDIPGIIDTDLWRADRSYFRGDRPILGRHSRDNAMKWPEDPADLEAAYPSHGKFDVRVMGGARAALKVTGASRAPSSWVIFETNEMPVRAFLNSLDYFVYFQHSAAYDAFGRAVLEALASGCVTILPAHFQETFGNAAIYAAPDQVEELVSYYHERPVEFVKQANRAMEIVEERFSFKGYASLIQSILAQDQR
ncbi:glycosyltransferase [Nesterenkonia rhizosphaerae]